ncbi:MAG: DNA polymerase IV [Lachnospiraceae bacterium]|nr:DNA polymerase IV [Lachnospiraceae bacterium]
MDRLIFHVDVNSAFLSWTSVKRLQNGLSDLRLVPSCIGGETGTRSGIVLAKSIPAKQFKIETAEPVSLALRKCPTLIVEPPDFPWYKQCSKAFKDICRSYAPAVEEYSIDEVFLDMTGTSRIYPDPVKTAYEIKDRIKNELGFTVNIGIGPNKLLAKMAGDFEKPDKVHTLFREEIPTKMWPLPVRDLLYCGKATAERLNNGGIYTIGELANANLDDLKKLMGEKGGEFLHRSANGEDTSEVTEEYGDAKSYSIVTTEEEDISDYERADRILLGLTDRVSKRLRRDGMRTTCISVTVRYLDFRTRSHQKKLDEPTDISVEIFETGKQLLRGLWNGKTPLRLIGIALNDVTKDTVTQLSLFPEDNVLREKRQKMDRTMDDILDRFGKGSLKRGSGIEKKG